VATVQTQVVANKVICLARKFLHDTTHCKQGDHTQAQALPCGKWSVAGFTLQSARAGLAAVRTELFVGYHGGNPRPTRMRCCFCTWFRSFEIQIDPQPPIRQDRCRRALKDGCALDGKAAVVQPIWIAEDSIAAVDAETRFGVLQQYGWGLMKVTWGKKAAMDKGRTRHRSQGSTRTGEYSTADGRAVHHMCRRSLCYSRYCRPFDGPIRRILLKDAARLPEAFSDAVVHQPDRGMNDLPPPARQFLTHQADMYIVSRRCYGRMKSPSPAKLSAGSSQACLACARHWPENAGIGVGRGNAAPRST